MTMNRRTFGLVAAGLAVGLLLSLAPNPAHADDSDVPGEVVIKTKFEFVKFTVNGKREWENHEYTNRRKTLVILGLSREDDNTIVLTPRVDGYEPLTLVIKPSDFKRRKVRKNKRRVAVYRHTVRAKFTKAGAEAPKAGKAKTAKKAKKAKKK